MRRRRRRGGPPCSENLVLVLARGLSPALHNGEWTSPPPQGLWLQQRTSVAVLPPPPTSRHVLGGGPWGPRPPPERCFRPGPISFASWGAGTKKAGGGGGERRQQPERPGRAGQAAPGQERPQVGKLCAGRLPLGRAGGRGAGGAPSLSLPAAPPGLPRVQPGRGEGGRRGKDLTCAPKREASEPRPGSAWWAKTMQAKSSLSQKRGGMGTSRGMQPSLGVEGCRREREGGRAWGGLGCT